MQAYHNSISNFFMSKGGFKKVKKKFLLKDSFHSQLLSEKIIFLNENKDEKTKRSQCVVWKT